MEAPKHVAIILDGNRRYAKKLGKKPWEGHEEGARNVERLLEWCPELGIEEITLYAFSTENFKRTKLEVDHLMTIFAKWFTKLVSDERIEKDGIRINFIGKLDMLPKRVFDSAMKAMEITRHNKNLIVNFALAYGGRMEIVEAVKKIVKASKEGGQKEITGESFARHLYLDSYPEIVIRTGGERRLSNFLLWQSAYSELFFVEKMWPEFSIEDLKAIIGEYSSREKRHGK